MCFVERRGAFVFKVDVSQIKENPGQTMNVILQGFPAQEKEGEGVIFSSPVKAVLQLTSTAGAILVQGSVQASVQLNCARCLEPFTLKLEAPFEEIYYHEGKGEEEWIPFSGSVIDFEPEIVKTIYLEVPMKAVCREECRGLCPQCGKNLNTSECNCSQGDLDPRLAKLQDFFRK
jgi:uncharacterized protein